jgi:hypothetical protein
VEEKRLFGEIAIEKGFITLAQLRRALDIQREMIRSGEGHKLVGVLLVELGYMTPEEVLAVLDAYDKEKAAELSPSESSTVGTAGLLGPEEDPLLPPGSG